MIYHISVHELFMGVKRTTFEGIPSTRINRRIFLVASSMSVADRDLTAVLYWMRILLKECAVCCADGSEEVAMGKEGKVVVTHRQRVHLSWRSRLSSHHPLPRPLDPRSRRVGHAFFRDSLSPLQHNFRYLLKPPVLWMCHSRRRAQSAELTMLWFAR